MSNKKPNVFPTQEQINQANETGEQINNQFKEENNITNQPISESEAKAAAEMKRRTEEQLRLRNEQLNKNQEISNQIEKTREEKMKEKQSHGGGNNTPPIYPTNNNYGGGNVTWWHDYIHSETQRANQHWREELTDVVQEIFVAVKELKK